MTTEYDSILYREDKGIGILSLNRPSRLNAISPILLQETLDVVLRVSRENRIRSLIIAGEGNSFCAGADLAPDASLGSSGEALGLSMRSLLNPLILALAEAPFPVIAAVQGSAAGAGAGLALAADFVVMTDTAKLVLPFSGLGIALDGGVSWFIARQLGHKTAMAVALQGEPINSVRAVELGIAVKSTQADQLMSEVLDLAHKFAQGPAKGYAAIKKQLYEAQGRSLAEALEEEAQLQEGLIESADCKEAISAFREKRKPNFVRS